MSNVAYHAHDAINLAGQIGRLDFISALLAAITLLLALASLPLFFYLRYRASETAKAEVNERMNTIEKQVEAEAISKMEGMLPILVEQYMELVRNSAPSQEADEIAQAQDDDPNANDI